jgi:hypothetical protein
MTSEGKNKMLCVLLNNGKVLGVKIDDQADHQLVGFFDI